MPPTPDEDTVYYTAWLLLHDETFLATHKNVSAHAFPKGCLQYLVALALKLGRPLQPEVVRAMVESDRDNLRRHGAEGPLVVQVFNGLEAFEVDTDASSTMRELCGTWLARRSLKVGLDEAMSALESSDYDRARAVLAAAQYGLEDRDEPLDLLEDADYILAGSRWVWQDAVPTGLSDLDRAFKGGLRAGDICILMGYTGMGKTMWACMLAARAFWAGRPVQYYTTELTKQQIQTRIALGILESGLHDLPKDKPFAELLVRAAKNQGYDVKPRANVQARYAEGALTDIEHDLERYKEEKGYYPGLLIIDSPIDLPPPGKHDKLHDGLRASFVWLRKLSRKVGCPIVVTAQTNRDGVEKAQARLKDMADAYAMAQKATVVLGLAQTADQRNEDQGEERTMTVYVLKDSNHGQTGGMLVVHPMFGSGDNGYPGAKVEQTAGLHLPVKNRDDDD